MSVETSVLQELDEAISRGTPESRKRALWHTTDVMIAGRYSDDEIWTFGEVIGRLADEIEVAARAQLARQLARFDRAPVNIIHQLAFDDSIEVAGPVLRESGRLEQYALVANACTKSQSHMLAISERKSIDEAVTDVAGALQSRFGPVSRTYYVAKRVVTTQYQQGNLNENSISGYARSHRLEEVTIGLSLLCSLPSDVIERAMMDKNRETLLILAKALDFSWATTMPLLLLGAKAHRITAQDLRDLEHEYGRLNVETSRSVLEFYQSRKNAGAADAKVKRQPAVA